MSIIGKKNIENAKWAIKTLTRTLQYAVKAYGIPATVTHFLSARYPYDLAIRPLPGAIFKPTGINSLFWSNTKARYGALYWSREFNGWRAWPQTQADKALGLSRWVDLQDPYGQAHAWAAITTTATSPDGSLVCSWAAMGDVMQYYARAACLPLNYLMTCPAIPYNKDTKRFDMTPQLLGTVLGVRGWAA
jgi:hypothetical protein